MKFSNLEDDFGCLFFYIDIYSMVAIHAALVMNFDVNFDVARIRTIFLYFNILHPDPFGTVEQRVLARMRRSANHLFLISLSLFTIAQAACSTVFLKYLLTPHDCVYSVCALKYHLLC